MEKRTATCRCGQLKVTCEGEPVRISVCHCLDCQRRSGSAFAAQARWPEARIMLTGRSKAWERVADSGHKATYQFCQAGPIPSAVVPASTISTVASAPTPSFFRKGDAGDWVLYFNAAEGDKLQLEGFGILSFAALQPLLIDGTFQGVAATVIDFIDPGTGAVDEIPVFGVAPDEAVRANAAEEMVVAIRSPQPVMAVAAFEGVGAGVAT